MQLSRAPGESKLDFHRRIVYGKLVDKSLADMDYTELAELVYGQPYSSDVARRMLYGSRRTLELIDSEGLSGVTDEAILKEIEEKKRELRKETQKFYDQRREYNKLVSSEGRLEHLYDSLANSAEKLNESVGVLFNTPVQSFNTPSDNEGVIVFSDWHYGMKANNVFNTYNTEICKQRVKNVVNQTIDRILLHNCNKLHIIILGDLFHGAIHTSARVASEELVCDQIMQVSEILAQAIVRLSRCVPETHVYTTYGNHGRTVQNKNDNIHRDNMERLIPWWLTQRLSAYDDIIIEDEPSDEYILLSVCGHDICASHGDLDSVKSSPRLLTALFSKVYGKDIEYIILGDKHHRESFEELGVTSMLSGSLCGVDDYANDKRLFSHPSQILLIMNPSQGLDAEYRIKCN